MQQTATTRCKAQRLRRGLTLRELAQLCRDEGAPVDFSHLSQIERGRAVPRPRLRAVLARVLELDVEDFERTAS